MTSQRESKKDIPSQDRELYQIDDSYLCSHPEVVAVDRRYGYLHHEVAVSDREAQSVRS